PILHSHLTKGWFWNSIQYKWKKKYKIGFKVLPNTSYQLTEFHFLDQQEEEIKF
ncbi:MAG: ribonuclease E/G, partial [Methanosarcinales archaeon]